MQSLTSVNFVTSQPRQREFGRLSFFIASRRRDKSSKGNPSLANKDAVAAPIPELAPETLIIFIK